MVYAAVTYRDPESQVCVCPSHSTRATGRPRT